MEYVGFIASFGMGIILGFMGGGGSILTVPILVYLFSLNPTIATGYSLFIVGITAFIGSLTYMRKGEIDFKTGLQFAVPSVIGVSLSRGFVIPQIPEVVVQVGSFTLTKEILIMITFATLMVTAAFSMIKKSGDQKPMQMNSSLMRFIIIVSLGLIVGMVAGFVGAGGGFLIIPALVLIAGLSMRITLGTSLMIIAIQSLLGFAGDVSRGMVIDWSLLGTVTFIAVTGIIIGSALSHKIKEQKLKSAFGWFVLIMGLIVLSEQFRHLSS